MYFGAGWLAGWKKWHKGNCVGRMQCAYQSLLGLFGRLLIVMRWHGFVMQSKEIGSVMVDGVGGHEVQRCLYIFCLAFSLCLSLLPSSRSDM
jgi:hypothetical protein